MIVLSHPTGNANVRGALQAFQKAGLLGGYYTTLGYSDEQLERYGNLGTKLQRRSYAIPETMLHSRPTRELLRLISKGRLVSVDAVYQDLDVSVAHLIRKQSLPERTCAVYAYEDGANATFQAAENIGMHRLYEQPIGYWKAARRILSEEAELQPEWASTIEALRDPKEKLERKDRELSLANHVIAASSFTQETLKEYSGALPDVSVIPYGCQASTAPPNPKSGGKLCALFVGGLSQRKGLSYLFEAVEGLESAVDLTVIGRGNPDKCPALAAALGKHTWIPSLSNPEILAYMQKSDVLIFPSLFEGFGLVITEALSQGIPVIATPHTAAPDIITNGKEGFIVPIRDASAIKEKLVQLIEQPEQLSEMKQNAWRRSQELTWELYGQRLVSSLKPYVKGVS